MKRNSLLLSSILGLGLVVGISAGLAQQPDPDGSMGPGMMNHGMMDPGKMRHGMMGRDGPMGRGGMMGNCPMMGAEGPGSSYIVGRLAFLKAELAITDAQQGAWDAYADATKRNLESMQGMRQTMQAIFDAKTPVERLDARLAAMESRITALKDVKPALTTLYGALSAEQKNKADEILSGMGCMM